VKGTKYPVHRPPPRAAVAGSRCVALPCRLWSGVVSSGQQNGKATDGEKKAEPQRDPTLHPSGLFAADCSRRGYTTAPRYGF
jgi:hypothetical protein